MLKFMLSFFMLLSFSSNWSLIKVSLFVVSFIISLMFMHDLYVFNLGWMLDNSLL